MGNKVKFTMKNLPDGLSQINVVILDTGYNKLWSGIEPVVDSAVDLDIGAVGVNGQAVWVYGNNATSGNEDVASVFGGYSLIEEEGLPPEDDTFLDENGAIYATSELNENSELWSNI